MQIEIDTGVFAYKLCTLGFNVVRNGRDGFVTNSHCTRNRGVSNDDDFHQPNDPLLSGNKIGDEDVTRHISPADNARREGNAASATAPTPTTASIAGLSISPERPTMSVR